ncbi:MAG: zinc-ribbon domain-containing protein [Patescibacteria group bacterium]|nr:zinc-ribbon domain-containing protein [Patescibacteria group bacterium]MDD4303919.1 zinc-ribbon domain-containing protein [Patescibacteria group bacterium]MDD4695094.1 zinc-ribbon domain-containing protein [Patescibacteria group bacterium]
MFCHRCGKELLENAKFCSSCGTEVHQIDKSKNNNQTSTQQKGGKISGQKIFKIIVIIILILTFISPSISQKQIALLDGVINITIWAIILYIISLFISPQTKSLKAKNNEIKKEIAKEDKEIKELKTKLLEKEDLLAILYVYSLIIIFFIIIILLVLLNNFNRNLLAVNIILLIIIIILMIFIKKIKIETNLIRQQLKK